MTTSHRRFPDFSPVRRQRAQLRTVALVIRASVTETGAMRSRQHACICPAPRSAFAGYRFPAEVITLAVRWYLRFGLSYRDVEELLAERGVEVDHVTVYRFAPEFAEAARARQHVIGIAGMSMRPT